MAFINSHDISLIIKQPLILFRFFGTEFLHNRPPHMAGINTRTPMAVNRLLRTGYSRFSGNKKENVWVGSLYLQKIFFKFHDIILDLL